MRFYERLQKLMKAMIFHGILFIKSLTFIPFRSIVMYFVDFCFRYWQFQNMTAEFQFRLDNFEILNFHTLLS